MKQYRYFFTLFALLAVLVMPAGCRDAKPGNIGGERAAIIDQLYIREPNPDFITTATHILESAGFKVDLWQGSAVTVDVYRKLPSLGYKLIVLRVHSGLLLSMENDKVKPLPNTYLFTAENYTTTRYVAEQLSDKVSNAMMAEDFPLVFAVNSEFIRDLKQKFDNAIVLAMGCESYEYDDMPQAVIDKGASLYVGWNYVVSLEYIDRVTLDLLENLCSANMPVDQGISKTMADLGRDPYFGSYLKYYPSTSGNMTLRELIR